MVPNIEKKRKKIESYIIDIINTMDPSLENGNRYKNFFANLTDDDFHQFMLYLQENKTQIHLFAPNMKLNLKMENLLKAADKVKLDMFEQIWMYDEATGKKFLTPHKYMVINIFVRRVKQYLEHKISIPENDKTIDGLTGQVTSESRSSAISQVEMQALYARNFDSTILELIKVRGGDIHAYSNFKRQIEESGTANLDQLETGTVAKSAVVASVFLKGMLLDNNIVEGEW